MSVDQSDVLLYVRIIVTNHLPIFNVNTAADVT